MDPLLGENLVKLHKYIQNSVKHIRWSFLSKVLMTESLEIT